MAKYRVTGPDGSIYDVTAPDDATPEQVQSMVAQSIGPQPEAVQKAGSALSTGLGAIPRQLGLAARAGLSGAGDVLGIVSNPIASAINLGFIAAGKNAPMPNASETMTGLADRIGLPKPETPTERVVQEGARLMAGTGTVGAAGKAAQLGTEGAKRVGQFLTQALDSQLTAAAGSGLFGGAVKEAGAGPGTQVAASLLGGVVGGSVPGAVRSAKGWITSLAAPKMTPQQLDIRIERMLRDQGVDWNAVPAGARASLRDELSDALSTGKELDPTAVRRLLDFKTVGATPTRGTITLDPVQLTREKNLSKLAANSSAGELHGLPRVENANNRALIAKLNEGAPGDPYVAGERAIGAIAERDARARSIENRLYAEARDSAGRAIPLDRNSFVNQAYENLAQSNKGAFLPESVGKLLEQIRLGKATHGGQEFDVPFNVDVIDNLKTTLASASRGTQDGNVKAALKAVRDALEATPAAPIKRDFGGSQVVTQGMAEVMQQADDLPAQALGAFDRARGVARARRTWQESAPAIEAALDGATPDQFIKKFVFSESAAFDDVSKLARELKRNPQAQAAVKSAIVGHLKDKALSGAADEVGRFGAAGYNRALNALERKLPLFFSAEEIAQLKAIGRVASYTTTQPVGSAVNNSNTAGMLAGRGLDALTGIANKLPFGRMAITDPIQSIMLSVGQSGAQKTLPGLLVPEAAAPLANRLAVPGVLTAGLLAAP